MNRSLFSQVTSLHPAHVVPMRCSSELLGQLARHFEDLAVENHLNALVIQGRCTDGDVGRGTRRFAKIAGASRHQYVFTCGRNCERRTWEAPALPNTTIFEQRDFHTVDTGPFFAVVDAHVSVLFASARVDANDDEHPSYYAVWSFEPDVVFTALEYLQARVSVQHPAVHAQFAADIAESAPHSPSLRLTLDLTTRLARLLQRQTEIETAVSRISSMINSMFQIDELYQGIVDVVGRTLRVRRATLVVWQRNTRIPEALHESLQPPSDRPATGPLVGPGAELETQIVSRGYPVGMLMVQDDSPNRVWEPEEQMMLRTVADHLAVGIVNARLVKTIEEQAMTDELTGLYNRRYFFDRLHREVQFSDRCEQPVSLVVVDFEGLPAAAETLRITVEALKKAVRSVDVLCRFGETAFACILPATSRHGGIIVADRILRSLDGLGVSADVGICAYPEPARNADDLLSMALAESRMSRT